MNRALEMKKTTLCVPVPGADRSHPVLERATLARSAMTFAFVAILLFCASFLAIKAAPLSGGTLVIWPGNGLILALMLAPSAKRPWHVLAAGEIGALAAFCLVDHANVDHRLVFALSRLAAMAISIPCTYFPVRRIVARGRIAESRILIPFLFVCAITSLIPAALRALVFHWVLNYPLMQLTLTTAASTFAGYAFITPLLLLLAERTERASDGMRARLGRFGIIGLYLATAASAFFQTRYPTLLIIPLGLVLVAHAINFVEMVFVVTGTASICFGLTLMGLGPIALFAGDMTTKVLLLQVFMVIIICSALPVSALINDQWRLKKALEAAAEQAVAGSRAKSAFVATISHEIRTPLNGLLGMAQVMALHELEPAQKERLAVLQDSGELLLSLLNNVLDISKIEAGQMALESIEFDMVKLIDSVVRNSRSAADEKGLALRCVTNRAAGLYLGDPTRLRQVVQNLVSNALKFTHRGSVTITASYDATCLTICVRDTGVGIAADKIETLFQKFRQVDESTTRRYGGTGLGLWICREIMQLMGGDIRLVSEVGAGSAFTATLPIARVASAPARTKDTVAAAVFASPPAPKTPPGKARLLAADDNEINRKVLGAILESLGATVAFANDGAEAVEAWRTEEWDAILMDVQMPVMDGPTAVKHIRALEKELGRPRTRIIALTANAMDHQVDEYLRAGMDGHIAKPIAMKAIAAMLASLSPKPLPS